MKLFKTSFFLSVLLWSSQAYAATTSDETFANTDWNTALAYDNKGTATFSANQGGSSNTYWSVSHTYGPRLNASTSHSMGVAHIDSTFDWNPESRGGLLSFDFSVEMTVTNGGTSGGVGINPLLYQDGKYFIGPYNIVLSSQTDTITHTDLVASDFLQVDTSGQTLTGTHPDFSLSGSTLQFGFLSSNGSSLTYGSGSSSRFDDYAISATAVPEPAHIAFVMSLTALASVIAIKKRTRTPSHPDSRPQDGFACRA